MRKILSLLLAALLLLALAGCSQAQEEEPLPESIEINFFYNEPCGACHDQINDFYDMFNAQPWWPWWAGCCSCWGWATTWTR